MAAKQSPLTIGIAGGTGSGKTTVANVILERVGKQHIAYLPHDAYYREFGNLLPDQKAAMNFDHPDSLETELMIKHIEQLKSGIPIEIPIYDFSTNSRTNKTIRVEPHPIIIVEGILLFTDKKLRELLDVKIFVDTDPDIRFIRRLQRDIAERGRTTDKVIQQYLTTVRPMHLEFVEPSKRYANVIIPEGGLNEVAMEMVIARIESLLNRNN
jgi:uridine kinase